MADVVQIGTFRRASYDLQSFREGDRTQIEKAIEHKFWPHAGRDEINLVDFQMILCAGFVMFVALIPFFGMRELGKVVGAAQMYKLFFVQRMRLAPLSDDKKANLSRPPTKYRKRAG
jgi:hypothetical protein